MHEYNNKVIFTNKTNLHGITGEGAKSTVFNNRINPKLRPWLIALFGKYGMLKWTTKKGSKWHSFG